MIEIDFTLWTEGGYRYENVKMPREDVAKISFNLEPIYMRAEAIECRQEVEFSISVLNIWYNGAGFAWVRLDEHCEHFARDRICAATFMDSLYGFVDEGGEKFSVPAAHVITLRQSEQVLAYWLQHEAGWSGVEWV